MMFLMKGSLWFNVGVEARHENLVSNEMVTESQITIVERLRSGRFQR